jgi:hypothetical protein
MFGVHFLTDQAARTYDQSELIWILSTSYIVTPPDEPCPFRSGAGIELLTD